MPSERQGFRRCRILSSLYLLYNAPCFYGYF
uniref:Uncharacterized protein n=1 Tax=Neisseria meningitidis alpha522 TaxID=996307 RepID=I4E4L8_NEIME|nr:hypothetical protein NMALPHA522_0743 [Neisseria meningitidis alpha522]